MCVQKSKQHAKNCGGLKRQAQIHEIFGSMPETSWLRPVFAVELPADHNDRILPKTTLGQ